MSSGPGRENSSGDLEIEVRDAEGPIVVALSGELDIATAPLLHERFLALRNDGRHEVLVDLRHLTFLDSTGVSALVMACKRVRTEGGSFSVVSPHPNVLRSLQVMGLVDYLSSPTDPGQAG